MLQQNSSQSVKQNRFHGSHTSLKVSHGSGKFSPKFKDRKVLKSGTGPWDVWTFSEYPRLSVLLPSYVQLEVWSLWVVVSYLNFTFENSGNHEIHVASCVTRDYRYRQMKSVTELHRHGTTTANILTLATLPVWWDHYTYSICTCNVPLKQ